MLSFQLLTGQHLLQKLQSTEPTAAGPLLTVMHQMLCRHLQNLKVSCRRGQRAEGSSHRQCESPENHLVMVQQTHCEALNYKILDLPLTCDMEEKASFLLDYRVLVFIQEEG